MSARADAPCYHAHMSEHAITLDWSRTTEDFKYDTYSRAHDVTFKNGQSVRFSAAVAYKGDADSVDPEEAFVASLASCHMLTFLAIACKSGSIVDSYRDEAVGHLGKNANGRLAIMRVELRPQIQFSQEGKQPTNDDLEKMHEKAHEACFIANSVLADVSVKSQ